MEATSLWKFLHDLCHNHCWDYAVFWKLQLGNQMLLKWEEGCYYDPTLRGSRDDMLGDMGLIAADSIFTCDWESNRHDECSYLSPVALSLDDMKSVHYLWGEGVVGEVAYTGNYSWILSEDLLACEFDAKVTPKCPEEWLVQFSTGIRTIVLIPIAQRGILQLGSSKKVGEDPALVAFISENCNNFLSYTDMEPTPSVVSQAHTYFPITKLVDNLDGSSTNRIMNSEDPEAVLNANQTSNKLSHTNRTMPVYLVEDTHNIRENHTASQAVGFSEILPFDNDKFGSSIVEEDLGTFQYSGYDIGVLDEQISINMKSYLEKSKMQPSLDENADSFTTDRDTLFRFSMDCELHKALGPSFQRQAKECPWDSSFACEYSRSSSIELLNRGYIQNIEPSTWESSEFLENRNVSEHILEPVFATKDSSSNDDLFIEPNDALLCSKPLGESEETVFVKKIGDATNSLVTNGPIIVTRSPPPFSSESMLSSLINEELQKKEYSYTKTKRGSKVYKSIKKKARPRDRQLIQDRVKELRRLVPNGSKYSIDGLLDRTIKHMLFLRSVTERAGKLKHWVHREVTSQKKVKSSSTKQETNKGASWALELGSDFQVCPIVVKDLEQPGHMLIEMVCNDHGLFLDIADVIRRLELTILKGVMESRVTNTWAHFVIEVSEGFQRLDIFWPLMQLLQKTQTPTLT